MDINELKEFLYREIERNNTAHKEIAHRLAEHDRKLEDMRVILAEIKTSVTGNGTKGLADRVDDLEKDVRSLRRRVTTLLLIGIALGFVAVLIRDGFEALTHIARLVP